MKPSASCSVPAVSRMVTAGIDPDADLHLHALRAAKLMRVATHDLLHPEGGIAGPHRVVFMGERRSEQRHNAVAHYLIDGALVVMDGVHHQREDWIDELARVLGIAVGEQLHGALEVGEENGDLFALTFEGSLGGEDLLGKVLWRVRIG